MKKRLGMDLPDLEDELESPDFLPVKDLLRLRPSVIGGLFRKYRNLRGALDDYARQGTGFSRPASGKKERRLAVEVADETLGPFPYQLEDTVKALRRSCKSVKPRELAREIMLVVPPVIQAYQDPLKFFRTTAPKLDPVGFDPDQLADEEGIRLQLTLWNWGCAAMLNEVVMASLLKASPALLSHAIDEAQGRPLRSPEGRPRFAYWQAEKMLRHDDVPTVAKKLGITEAGVEKRIKRGPKKRKGQRH
jgi:hypothetical protein